MYDDRMTIVRPQPLTQLNMYCGRGSPADTVRNAGNVSMGHHFWEGPPREGGGGRGVYFPSETKSLNGRITFYCAKARDIISYKNILHLSKYTFR